MTNESTPQRRTPVTAPTYAEICRAYDAAIALARTYCPKDISSDAFQEGALKWWRTLTQGRIRPYILEKHDSSKISATFLSYWILRSARDFQSGVWAAEARKKEHGFTGAQIDPELESYDPRDPTAVPVDEQVAGRIDAERAITALGSWEEIDLILRLRAEDVAYDEIAAELGTTVGTARVHAHRERGRAGRRLANLGFTNL